MTVCKEYCARAVSIPPFTTTRTGCKLETPRGEEIPMAKSVIDFAVPVLISLLCSGAATLPAASAIPTDFAPNANVGWISVIAEYTQPPSGPGPVARDPTKPHVTNEEYRRTGRQTTIAVGDPNSPILQPWAKEQLRKHNEIVLSGKGGLSRK